MEQKTKAKIAETTYPKAAIIIANLGKKFPGCFEEIWTKVSKPKTRITPKNPTNIDINFLRKNLSSLIKK